MASRDLWVRIRADVSGFSNGIRSAQAQTRAFASEVEKSAAKRQAVSQLGGTFLKAGAVVGAGAALMVKAAMDWESAWAGVTKTVEFNSAKQAAAIEGGLRSMAQTLPATHKEIAAVAEAAGALGVKTGGLLQFTRVMVNLGETTNLTADEAATSIAQMMNVMQTAPQNVGRLGAALVELGNNGASTEREIIQMSQRIAGAGKIVGLTEQNVLGIANAMASVGIEVEAGGSSVSRILTDIAMAVSAGGADLEAWASTAQMSAKQFAAAWEADPARAFASVVEGLGAINEKGGDVFATLSALGQTDIRVSRALLSMAGAGDLLSKSLSQADAAWAKNTALADEAAKRYDTSAAKAKIAWNGIKDNAIDAGQAMLPVVAGIADGVAKLTSAFSGLPGPVKSALGALTGTTAVALLAVGGYLKLVSAVASYRNAMATMAATNAAGSAAMGKTAKQAGILAAAFVAVNTATALLDSDATAGVGKYTKAILELGSGGGKAIDGLSSNWRGLSARMMGLDNFSASIREAQRGMTGVGKAFSAVGSAFGANPFGDATADVKAYDAALAGLVQQGALKQAADGAAYFMAQAKKGGVEAADAKSMLSQYSDALADSKVQAKLAGDAAGGFAGKAGEIPPAVGEAMDKIKAMSSEVDAAARNFVNFGDVAGKSLKGYIADLERGVKAQVNWSQNVLKATARGLDPAIIEDFRKMGPEGAKMLERLANGAQSNIERMNRAFRSSQAEASRLKEILATVPPQVLTELRAIGGPNAAAQVVALAKKYKLTPDVVKTLLKALDFANPVIKDVMAAMRRADREKANPKIDVNSNHAKVVAAAKRALNSIPDELVNIFVRRKGGTPRRGFTGDDSGAQADGGVVDYYGRGGFRENHVAQIAPAGAWRVWAEEETGGEAYIPLAASKRKRSLDTWAETGRRLGVEGMASGGVRAAGGGGVAMAGISGKELRAAVFDGMNGATLLVRQDGRGFVLQTRVGK